MCMVSSARADELWPDLSSPPKATGGGEKDAAVIVGVEKYAFVEEVPGAKDNANAWQAYLTDTLRVPPEKVALLRDDDATNDEIRQAAVDKASQVEPGGTLWFVFIGHGAPSKDGKDGLLVGVDAQRKTESVYKRSLSRNELLGLLAKGKQEKTVVLIDACFSGKAPSGRDLVASMQPLVPMLDLPQDLDKRSILLTAARSNQFAGSLPKAAKPRPAFSYLALGALRGWAADAKGRVTSLGIVEYAKKALSLAHDRAQTPELVAGSPGSVLGWGRESPPDLAKIDREGGPSVTPVATVKPAKETVDKATVFFEVAGLEASLTTGRPLIDGLLKASKGGAEACAARSDVASPAEVTAGKAGIQWVTIPSGTSDAFWSGTHITLNSFQIAKTLVTNKQYKACVNAGKCTAARSFGPSFAGNDQPVVGVNWSQANAFCEWVGGRLPSELEWEYAATSGGKDCKYPWGSEDATCSRAVIRGCGTVTAPVCSTPDGNTALGLCDMAGNALEWMQEWYEDSGNGMHEDKGTIGGPPRWKRPVRGGSWLSTARDVQIAVRSSVSRDGRTANVGFRPARTLDH